MPTLDQERKTVRFPLIGEMFHRENNPLGVSAPAIADTIDQRFVNVCYRTAQNPLSGDKRIWAFKRPGIGTSPGAFSNVTAGCYSALQHNPSVQTYSIFQSSSNTNQIKLFVGVTLKQTVTVTGNLMASRITPFYDAGNFKLAFWVRASTASNNKAFIYNIDADTLTEITDGDFPVATLVGNFVYKDGYLFIMTTDGKIYSSDINAPTSWNATAFLSVANTEVGGGICRYRDKIVAFSTNSLDFYENVGNPVGSPLQRVDNLYEHGVGLLGHPNIGGFEQNGCGHAYLEAYDTVFWISDNANKIGLYTLNEYKPVQVSSPNISFLIGAEYSGNWSDLTIAGTVLIAGHRHLLINMGRSSVENAGKYVLVFNLDLGLWSIWQWGLTDAITYSTPIVGSFPSSAKVLIGSSTYIITLGMPSTHNQWADNSNAYTMTIQTSIVDLGTTSRKRLHKLTLLGSDSGATATTGISWSDNDYQTFTTARNVDLNNQRTYLDNCGMFRRRAFRITNSTNTPWEAEAMEFEVSMMSS